MCLEDILTKDGSLHHLLLSAIIMKIIILCQIRCLNLDKKTDSSLFSSILLFFRGGSYARKWLCFICFNPFGVVKKN